MMHEGHNVSVAHAPIPSSWGMLVYKEDTSNVPMMAVLRTWLCMPKILRRKSEDIRGTSRLNAVSAIIPKNDNLPLPPPPLPSPSSEYFYIGPIKDS